VGGEYSEGAHLEALVTFVLAAAHGLTARGPLGHFGPAPTIQPAREKFGWYLPPTGPARDMLRGGWKPHWQSLVEEVWAWARPSCNELHLDPEPVDYLIRARPWRLELGDPPDACTLRVSKPPDRKPLVQTGPRQRHGDIEGETEWITWEHVVWRFEGSAGNVFAVIATCQEAEFLQRLDRGEYDVILASMTRFPRRWRGGRLLTHAQIEGAAWWRDVRPGSLVPAERDQNGSIPVVTHRSAARALREMSSTHKRLARRV